MSIANLNTDDSDLVEDEQYVLDGKGLREKLLDIVAEQEEYVKKTTQCLFVPNLNLDRTQRAEEFNESVDKIIGSTKKLNSMLDYVKPHQEREEYIRKLQGEVNERDAVIRKLARELKTIETSLVEATFQAQKKLKSIKKAQENKVNSEEVVRLSHLISRSYSVAAPFTWVQGDPSRPFPTEADFAVSQLMNSRNYSIQSGPTALAMIRGPPPSETPRQPGSAVSTPMTGQVRASPLAPFQQQQQQQRNWTPSPRSGVYGPQQQSSPSQGRGRPRGSTSSPRILRGSSNASPRLTSPMARNVSRPTLKIGRGGGTIGTLTRPSMEDPPMSSSESSSDDAE